MNSISVVVMIISILGIIINGILGFSYELILAPFFSFIIFLSIYFWSRKGVYLNLLKSVITLLAFVFNNLFWFYNYGSHGPAPYLFVVTYSLLVFVWQRIPLYVISAGLVINLAVLFYLELNSPDIISDYDSPLSRIIDSYTGTLMYGIFIFVMIKMAKDYLLKEYLKATEADRLKTAFLENMSHEIRTPLNAIVGFSGMIAQDELTPSKKHEFSTIIDSNNALLLRLIDDILDMSKIESNTFEISKDRCHLNPILDVIKTSYEQKLANSANDVAFHMVLPAKNIFLMADGTRINQVLVNLIDNAIKFTEKGQVVVSTTYNASHIKFSVQDTGIGVSEEDLEQIFERFYKGGHDTDALYGGTGIGLYLCKHFVELMEGKIWVESKVGVGSTFSFTLPIDEAEIEDILPESTPTTSGFYPLISNIDTTEELKINKTKILIVEDIESNLKLLETLLKRWKYNYISATTGKQALQLFDQHTDIDLVLLDINLPDISGLQLFKWMKEQRPEVKIIAQTAYAMKEDENRCRRLGFDGFLRKPIESELLRLHLRHHLKAKDKK